VTAAVFGIRALPSLLIGPMGGVIGDRFERKKVLLVNSCYMALLAMGFAALVGFGDVQAWHILLFTMLQGTGQAIVGPVRQAMVANTVPREELMNAIALNSFAFNVMRIIGPAIAGVLIALFGPALNFGIQGGMYVLAFVLILPMQIRYTGQAARRVHESFRESFVGGIAYVRGQRTIMGLILLALVPALFTTPINIGLLPVYAKDVLHVSATGLGLLFTVQGIGAVIGSLAMATLSGLQRKGLVLSVAACCLTMTIFLYSQVPYFFLAVPLLGVATCCFMTYNTINQTIIQTITPDEYRGRVMGLQMMDHGLSPLGSLVFGTIAEFWGVQTAISIAGLCGLSFVLLILARFPSIRAYRTAAPVEVVAPRARESVAAGSAAD
jgi:MFS transporter, DHA1 family, staphyloferrin A biosynthesis exporter